MAVASVVDSNVLATMVLEMWIGEHARCVGESLEGPPIGVGGQDDSEKRRLQLMAIWQAFWGDFCDLCERFAQRVDQCDDQKLDFTDPILNASPLRQLAVIIPLLGLPDDLWNAASLLRDQCRSEIGAPEVVGSAVAARGRRIGSDARRNPVDEATGEKRADTLNHVLREILAELRRIGRRAGMPGFDRLMTEPLTKIELGHFGRYHRNQVPKLVLPRCQHQMVGKRYRLYLTDMPIAYFLQRLRAVRWCKDRKETGKSHHQRDAHYRRTAHASPSDLYYPTRD